jgi:pantoate--beta-alanine ligase
MVKIIKSSLDLINERSLDTKQIGFVPTMGNLHDGHLSLLEKALTDNDVVYFSIFVNPKQFSPTEDFQKYPRTLSEDVSKIENTEKKFQNKKIVIFAPPTPEEIFPGDFNQTISVVELCNTLEGKQRPGHFDGVATVVFQLFQLIRPNKAYFGLKDFQQYLVIRKLVRDLAMPTEIIGMPTVRDFSGLALSSRNQYLSDQQREQALILPQSLKKIADIIEGKKENLAHAKLEIDRLIMDKNWNYLEMRDAENLSTDLTSSSQIAILGVYQLGTTRLLDNIQLGIK